MSKPALRVIAGGDRPQPPAQTRLNLLASLLCRWVMAHVKVDPAAVDRLRRLAEQGTIVYVMRYRSLVDYLLALHVLEREGLPVPVFANDTATLLLRPLRDIIRVFSRRLRAWRPFRIGARQRRDHLRCMQLVRDRHSVLIFTRHQASGVSSLAGARSVIAVARTGPDYLRDIVHGLWSRSQRVFIVPLAVLRGKGFRRRESRIVTLLYTVQEAPGEVRRLLSLLWNRHDTQMSVGSEILLREFMELHRSEEEERIVRRLVRSLNVFMAREERTVWGPTLLPKREVRRRVLQGEDLAVLVRQLADSRKEPESKIWRAAERYFDEMAANFNSIYFTTLEFAFNRIWPRVFQGLEYTGLERVIDRVKEGPVVLVPCHRSHFDYLILSYIFHNNYLSPPHIAAGINLSFWPLGPLFRGAGAFFIRRSFEDNPLYKLVFRKYLTFLIREGYTQEFFIEGGRSRTGKMLNPKLGMLSAIVASFVGGTRRDLSFVPVSIHYGRIVEEEAYTRELSGAEKETESLTALLRARTVLRQKYGTAYVTFGEPISLNEALGEQKERFREQRGRPEVDAESRRFVQKLGFGLLRAVNDSAVAGATSVSASVLLGGAHAAVRLPDFLALTQSLVDYLRRSGVRFTSSLERNAEHEFRESIAFLGAAGLVRRIADPQGDVLFVPVQKRLSLDFYKNNTIHFFLLPAVVTRALARGLYGDALFQEVAWWLDLFRWEFPLPDRGRLEEGIATVLDYLREVGALSRAAEPDLDGAHPFVRATMGLLDNFQEAYWMAARSLEDFHAPLSRKAVTERMRKRHQTALLLGEVRKPEGGSTVTLGNALERFRELGIVRVTDGTKRRDRILPGPAFENLPGLIGRLAPETTVPSEWPAAVAAEV